MTPGEWIALASLILAIGGFVWWAGKRDEQLQHSTETSKQLAESVVLLTKSVNAVTLELRHVQTRLESFEEKIEGFESHMNRQTEALWNAVDKIRDRL